MDNKPVGNEDFLRMMVDSMIKSFEAIANKTTDEKTRDYATKVVKLNRDTLAKMEGFAAHDAIVTTE